METTEAAMKDTDYRVYRFDDERDGSRQTCLGTFGTEAEALRYAERHGGHQVQRGLDGEVTGVQAQAEYDDDDARD
jgi:hypothetical protein